MIVEREVLFDPGPRIAEAAADMHMNLLVLGPLSGSTKTFVTPTAFVVYADLDAVILEHLGKLGAGGSLVGVDNLGLAVSCPENVGKPR